MINYSIKYGYVSVLCPFILRMFCRSGFTGLSLGLEFAVSPEVKNELVYSVGDGKNRKY